MKYTLLSLILLLTWSALIIPGCGGSGSSSLDALREGFVTPPLEARPRALWDWVDGNVQKEQITFEMEEARRMGLGGFDIWDVRSVVDEDSIVPAGPAFMSGSSVEAICYAINEAERLSLDLGLIIASGWNAGGAWTLPEHQTMGLFRSEATVRGPGDAALFLEFPDLPDRTGRAGEQGILFIPRRPDGLPEFWSEVCVLAYRETEGTTEDPVGEVLNLSGRMKKDGKLQWKVPPGSWKVVRYVCANTGQPMYSSSPNSRGPMIDHFNAEASERHIEYFIRKLETALGKPLGKSGLSYFYTDSYEVKGQLWTPSMTEEFEQRMGYSLLPYLPVLEGRVVQDRETSLRFMYDFRRVLSDLIIENHYLRTREICEEHGVGFVAEAAGPGPPIHNCPFESLKSSGVLSFPRGEFWHLPENTDFWRNMDAVRKKHYLDDLEVIKGVASASHIYDRKYVEAEAFTGTHLWNEGPGDLKPTADRAFCEGLNRIVFHTWPHTPEEAGTPGWAYAFGTIMNEHRIWWPMARPWMDYLGRCSYLLQQGNFKADLLFYYGDSVPNFVPAKHWIEGAGFGFDYDVINTDVLLNRLEVNNGRFVLPHGPSYEILVLPEEDAMPPEVLSKLAELVEEGGIICGRKPSKSTGLRDREERDRKVKLLAGELWGECDGQQVRSRSCGSGKVCWGIPVKDILAEKGIGPDVKFDGDQGALDFIHRETGGTGLYFLRNRTDGIVSGTVSFRQGEGPAELWDPSSGAMIPVTGQHSSGNYQELSLRLEACESVFVVFPAAGARGSGRVTGPASPSTFQAGDPRTLLEVQGPWTVHFPESEAGAGNVVFDSLQYWNERPEDGIRFFSGIASYAGNLEWNPGMADQGERVYLDLGDVVEVARVSLNGRDAGILWKKPFRADVTDLLAAGRNELRIEVANTWANGLAGDARLPVEKRRTKTNITRLPNAWAYPVEEIPNEEYGLIPAGLAGPVRILAFPGATPPLSAWR